MADEEISIEVADTGGAVDPIDDLKKQHEELSAAVERERAGRMQAEQYARAVETNSYAGQLDSAISQAEQTSAAARLQYEHSLSEGNWSESGAAQERIAQAQAHLVALQQQKQQLEAQARQPQQTPDPAEAFISQCSAPSQAWLRAHRDLLADERGQDRLRMAHYAAKSAGHVPDSKSYFTAVEDALGLKPSDRARSENGQYASNKRPAPVAPVSSSSYGANPMRGGTVKLSPNEIDLAENHWTWNRADVAAGRCRPDQLGKPLGREGFARKKLAMMRDGRYNNPEG